MSDKRLWTPDADRIEHHPMTSFSRRVSPDGKGFRDYAELHTWSIDHRRDFWDAVWDDAEVVGEKGAVAFAEGATMREDRYFPEARLNFAENLLAHRGEGDAIVFRGEDKVERRLSWSDLVDLVSRLQQAFRAEGIQTGDRVAAMMPNMPETVAAMLAASSLGAVFCSCSPDFGERGAIDRFGQIEPAILLVCDGYYYAGKTIDVTDKVSTISRRLGVRRTVVVPYIDKAEAVAAGAENGVSLPNYLEAYQGGEPTFERLPFDHPLYILFSSGTTGTPKCIVHGAGGTLLTHLKEHRLHCGNTAGSRVFYFTTCGWMMWNWVVSTLATGATLLLYDGSPFHPNENVLLDYVADEKATFFGTSAKYIDTARKNGQVPRETHDLSALRVIASTGSPLSPEAFDYVYADVKNDVHLASISGGTDIVACFVLGIPWLPVHEGEIQGPGLGMAVDVFDENGRPLASGKGDLVCKRSFPSMPVKFWNDPDGQRYTDAYFADFDGIWCHGDFAEWTERGGLIIHGRSDATLNPQGVRIGTAEIYNVVEQMEEVAEAICIGQPYDDDVRVVLFVRLAGERTLDDDLVKRIQRTVREQASPRHVPAKVLQVDDIPRTKSGKIVELAVREVVEGRPVKNKEALANPEALDQYADRSELAN